ncbi:hypothetical protein M422DRAFT_242847 [Sphaerobolus stellatus SS14]|nr:hypothetical protein M422DRAFT_242847 [Sphaerobolus stellatus SS14]
MLRDLHPPQASLQTLSPASPTAPLPARLLHHLHLINHSSYLPPPPALLPDPIFLSTQLQLQMSLLRRLFRPADRFDIRLQPLAHNPRCGSLRKLSLPLHRHKRNHNTVEYILRTMYFPLHYSRLSFQAIKVCSFFASFLSFIPPNPTLPISSSQSTDTYLIVILPVFYLYPTLPLFSSPIPFRQSSERGY